MSRVLLLSTYELGARPLGCTVPAGHLAAAGHEVRSVDLAVQPWPEASLAWAEAVALSVPMHTALRLGLAALERLRSSRPELPVCLHGLYAHAAGEQVLRPADLAVTGEAPGPLLEWLERLPRTPGGSPEAGPGRLRHLGPARPGARAPARPAGLPELGRYARLAWRGEERLVGTLETTTGCNHRCRHCPVPVVYRGRSRPVALPTVLAEAEALVAEGAHHLHLADPDFLNRPEHALAFARALSARHGGVTFDATVKVSHVLRHRALWAELAACGLLFVISAFESTSDLVLDRLDKGHRAAEAAEAVAVLREAGVEPRPSFLPFTPWTTRQDLVELLDFVAREDLVWNVEPVQYGIRLLLPPGSLLLEHPDPVLAGSLGAEDAALLNTSWAAPDPLLDECQRQFAARVEADAGAGADPEATYLGIRSLLHELLGQADLGPPPAVRPAPLPGPLRPRLTEAWFCCAEPTAAQLAQLTPMAGPSPDDAGPVPLAVPTRRR